MTTHSSRSLLLSAVAGLSLSLLSALPAAAHGSANSSLINGVLHPLLGIDHLLLLLGCGLAAAQLGPVLLIWAMAGVLLGHGLALATAVIPAMELLAALSVAALGASLLISHRHNHALPLVGSLLGMAAAVHTALHIQAGAGSPIWGLGALLTTATSVGLSFVVARRLNQAQASICAAVLMLLGGTLALAPL
jgi:urease accessory protein